VNENDHWEQIILDTAPPVLDPGSEALVGSPHAASMSY
jgi:hypothetical protein